MFDLAFALAESGQAAEAAEMFRHGYLKQPAIYLLSAEGPAPSHETTEAIRNYTGLLIRHGAAFSPVIAAHAVAEAASS